MANKPTILTPREPLTDGQGNVTRSWWRFLNDLVNNSGSLATPVVVQPSALLTGTTIISGGTISSPNLPPGTLIGNSDTIAGQPATLAVDPSLSLSNGTIAIASIPGGSLFGNAGAVAAPPGAVAIGAGLSLTSTGSLVATGDDDTQTLAFLLPDRSGEIAALGRKVNDALTIGMLAPRAVSQSATAAATAIYAPLVNGDLPGPTLMADPFGQVIMVEIR